MNNGSITIMETYINILRSHDLKATPQRMLILEIVEKFGHINIDELYEKVKEKYAQISLATIYKNINAMCDNGVLVELKLPNKKNVYEMAKEQHAHLLCTKCGNVTDVNIVADTLGEEIAKKHHFAIETKDVILKGICSKCS